MTESQKVIQEALARYRGIRWVRTWLVFFGTIILAMALTALLDRIWIFSGWARWSGWIAGLVVAAWAARRVAGPTCPDASALAHWVEAEAEETVPVVATAIDPAVRQTAQREALAHLLLDRLDLRADKAIRTAPPMFRGLLRAPVALAAVAVATLATLIALHGGQGLLRMLLPWQASPYTSLTLKGPEEPVAEGQAFTLTARVSGVPVKKVTLYRQGSMTPLAEAVPGKQGLVHLSVDGLDGPADFVVRGGDGQSKPLRVDPYLLPNIETFEITVTPPSYASAEVGIRTNPSFSAFRGSQLRYRIRLKSPAVSIAFDRTVSAQKEEWATPEEMAHLDRTGLYMGSPLLGESAPDWDIDAWINATGVTRESFHGKVVLVDFWAMWCVPCIATFPHLQEWRREFGDKGFEIVGVTEYSNFEWDEDNHRAARSREEVSPADERTTLERFLHHYKLEHPVFVMPKQSDMRRDYGARGFPHVVLIGRDGIVRLVKTGASETIANQIHAKIKELIEAEPAGSEKVATAKSDGPTFRQDPDDPLVWEADWSLPDPDDIVYRLAIADRHGNLVRNDKPWRIDVLSDEAPQVQIRRRLGDEVITTGKETVQFDLSAMDDVRLAELRLIYRKPGSPHTRREIKLPPDAVRTWSGTELLDLAPLDLRPFDMVAVHAEAEDGNVIDGPGVGRSEVVFLEVPLPASDDAGGEGGGGQEDFGGTPPINPLVLQMEILRSTMVLPDDAPAQERASIAHDQRQNAAYTGMIQQTVASAGASDLAAALGKAQAAMEAAAGSLDSPSPSEAVPDEEAALGHLIDAARLMEEEEAADLLQPGEDKEIAAEGMRFQLRPPQSRSSLAQTTKEDVEKKREDLRKLLEEVRRQLAEQEKLNQEDAGERDERAGQQQELAGDARSAASLARAMDASAIRRGDPQATAEELDRAAGLQDDTAEALAGGDDEASAQLGAQSAEALTEALRQLAAEVESETVDGQASIPGYERLINDYLRSISYE